MDELQPHERIANRSLNHPMQSGFAAWFHESVGGIRPAAPGFKRIELNPHGYTRLAWAKTAHDSPYGQIKSEWRNAAGSFKWSVTIPANTPLQSLSVPSRRRMASGRRTPAGAKFLQVENDRAIYEVDSGSSEFKSGCDRRI